MDNVQNLTGTLTVSYAVKRLGAGDGEIGGRPSTGTALTTALEAAGVVFIDENGGGAGVRLRKLESKNDAGG